MSGDQQETLDLKWPVIVENQKNEDYHKKPQISQSNLKLYLESPELYKYYKVDGNVRDSTESMRKGSLVHDFVTRTRPFILIPDEVLTSNGAKRGKKWDEFAAKHEGAELLKEDEYNWLKEVQAAVLAHPVAGKLIRCQQHTERSIYWVDKDTGLILKARPDFECDECILDLKTAASVAPSIFSRACAQHRYDIQATWYIEAVRQATQIEKPWIMIAVETFKPYRVRTYQFTKGDLAQTSAQVRNALDRLSDAYRKNDWRDEGWDETLYLGLPSWLYAGEGRFSYL